MIRRGVSIKFDEPTACDQHQTSIERLLDAVYVTHSECVCEAMAVKAIQPVICTSPYNSVARLEERFDFVALFFTDSIGGRSSEIRIIQIGLRDAYYSRIGTDPKISILAFHKRVDGAGRRCPRTPQSNGRENASVERRQPRVGAYPQQAVAGLRDGIDCVVGQPVFDREVGANIV